MSQAAIMRCMTSVLLFIAFTLLSSTSNSRFVPADDHATVSDSSVATDRSSVTLAKILTERRAAQFVLGTSQQGREVQAFYFPGKTERRALIIGGMHGSELSSIEVAAALLRQLRNGDSTHYSVIVVPSLFPDNAATAKKYPARIGDPHNIGRYSFPGAVDPNRQMPTPGQSFDEDHCRDHIGRKMENETTLLLDLINQYRPQRIVNLHAIRDTARAGVFADPRTDHNGLALGYESDSSLAVSMALAIREQGGYVPGNHLHKKPNALYYKDPLPVEAGQFQPRNFRGSFVAGQKGGGVSLGTWASTAVVDPNDPNRNRDAMRIITMEFPGSKRPQDHQKEKQDYYRDLVETYATSIRTVFLGDYFPES
jgi:hypothetical protein